MKLNKFGDVLQQKASPLPFDSFVHDSVISQNYMVYFLPPYYIPMDSIFQFLAGQSPLGKLSEWDPNIISRVHVHCKDDLELKWVIDLPNAMSSTRPRHSTWPGMDKSNAARLRGQQQKFTYDSYVNFIKTNSTEDDISYMSIHVGQRRGRSDALETSTVNMVSY